MTEPRCYTLEEVRAKLKLPRRSFYDLKKAGKLPFLEELQPRLGMHPRFRADLLDRYLSGQWRRPSPVTRTA